MELRSREERELKEALAYFIECRLADIETVRMRKKHSKRELERHINIAQKMIEDVKLFRLISSNPNEPRLFSILEQFNGNVRDWVEHDLNN
jgi:hypothetical protein